MISAELTSWEYTAGEMLPSDRLPLPQAQGIRRQVEQEARPAGLIDAETSVFNRCPWNSPAVS